MKKLIRWIKVNIFNLKYCFNCNKETYHSYDHYFEEYDCGVCSNSRKK